MPSSGDFAKKYNRNMKQKPKKICYLYYIILFGGCT